MAKSNFHKSVLVVEDDLMIGQSLNLALRDTGIEIAWVQDGESGQQEIESGKFDLVLLDLGLPRKTGMEVLKAVRTQGNRTPIFVITARDCVDDRVAGLDGGADDYLVKPFSFEELNARIASFFRRRQSLGNDAISNGEIVINVDTQVVNYRGKTVVLQGKELVLLQSLVKHPGMILSRSQIEHQLYGWNERVDSNVVEVLIHALRKKFDNEIVRNVRGVGWMVTKYCA